MPDEKGRSGLRRIIGARAGAKKKKRGKRKKSAFSPIAAPTRGHPFPQHEWYLSGLGFFLTHGRGKKNEP